MIHLLALGLLALLGRAVFVYISPERTCRWCRGERKRRRGCWRCKGDGKTWRLGARLVHKVRLAIGQAWAEREWWR